MKLFIETEAQEEESHGPGVTPFQYGLWEGSGGLWERLWVPGGSRKLWEGSKKLWDGAKPPILSMEWRTNTPESGPVVRSSSCMLASSRMHCERSLVRC